MNFIKHDKVISIHNAAKAYLKHGLKRAIHIKKHCLLVTSVNASMFSIDESVDVSKKDFKTEIAIHGTLFSQKSGFDVFSTDHNEHEIMILVSGDHEEMFDKVKQYYFNVHNESIEDHFHDYITKRKSREDYLLNKLSIARKKLDKQLKKIKKLEKELNLR